MRVYLRHLPEDHPLRNKPLQGAFYHAPDSKVCREVFPSYGIAKKTYNQLSDAWTGRDEFYFDVADESHRP